MNRKLYDKFANYYLDKFKKYRGLKIKVTIPVDGIMHIEIGTSLPSFCYFFGLFNNMAVFDGINVCDDGIEFDDINTVDPQKIYDLIDEEFKKISAIIEGGVFMFCYKDGQEEVATSTDVLDRNKLLKNLDIREFYNKNKVRVDPPFEELDRIELKDFYNNVVYEYDVSKKEDN